jgi:ankyrin repeat protein
LEIASRESNGNIIGDTYVSALSRGAQYDDNELVDRLLQLNANPNGYPVGRYPPIVFGCNCPTIIRSLVSYGADVNRPNVDGQTALMGAAGAGRLDSVELLLELGAKAEPKDKAGHDALSFATIYKHSNIAELLRKRTGG